MARTVAIGVQDFETLVSRNCFYVDKTNFIREWWENEDNVTLITRPRRFGKTLTMNMVERFFSVKFAGEGKLFEGLNIWKEPKYRELQGTYPVIFLSFANVKNNTYKDAKTMICHTISDLYNERRFLRDSDALTDLDREYFDQVNERMSEIDAAISIQKLCDFMRRYYGKKAIILLDEYDTPMQEAYVYDYWEEIIFFMRNFFNSTFKTNPHLERAIMTGITRVSKESIFSDLNNLAVITSTSNKYADSFGFTQTEVSASLREFGLLKSENDVKDWYDGFTFGTKTDIYNPWSIINLLEEKRLGAYWANTSSNSLVGKLIREGSKDVKYIIEDLLNDGTLRTKIDEQIVFHQLGQNEEAIWSLFLASGYLKVENWSINPESGEVEYTLKLTNKEVKIMFRTLIRGWFQSCSTDYNDFIKALLLGDIDAMNEYMNRVALATFSNFDTGKKPSKSAEPERFYHGFVLGLMMNLSDRYTITSNRESGFGRYDVMLEPIKGNEKDDAIILEFKVFHPKKEKDLEETVNAALLQIEEKKYAAALIAKGVPEERIRKYGFAFEGKNVLIG